MADSDYNSNLGNADILLQYPSAASPLSIDELMKTRAVSTPPPSWTGGWVNGSTPNAGGASASQPVSGQDAIPTSSAPAASDGGDQTPRSAALRGLGLLTTNLQNATQEAQNIPVDDKQIGTLNSEIAAKAEPTQMRSYTQPDETGVGTGKILPQYAPTLGQRIVRGLRGAAVGTLEHGILGGALGAVAPEIEPGGTAYGAPNQIYNRTEAERQTDLSNLQGQRQALLDALKRSSDMRKAKASEFRANASLGKDLTTGASDVMKADTAITKNNQLLREHGLITDDQGNIAAVPYDQMTPNEQAQFDLRNSQSDLADAKAQLARAQSDPNSPAYQLAMARVRTAQQNASAAMIRANAYALNATGANYGTDTAGNPLQGATVVGGKPVGSRFQSTVQGQQSRVAQFNDVLGATNNLENTARRLVTTRGKGALSSSKIAAALAEPAGTFGKWMQGQVANGQMSPEERDYVTNLRAYRENLQALRKSAGGGVSDSQVDRLMEMAPGAATPDLDYLMRQTNQIRQTANRLSQGIPNIVGGVQVEGGQPALQTRGGQQTNPPAAGGVFGAHRRIE